MSEPLHPFLPKRRTGKQDRFRVPTSVGLWEQRPSTDLDALGMAIETPPVRQQVYSIPDPWARAILFDRALRHEEHILHRRILGEWRGLLAILGLRDVRGYKGLSVGTVDLGTGNNGKSGSFSSILGKLQPRDQDLISGDTTWQRFHILRWQLKPFEHHHPLAFAFTSPMTLVATGADYASRLSADEVRWFDGEVLTDPGPALSGRERKALAEWICGLAKLLSGQVVVNSTRRGDMLERLNNFAADLDHTVKTPDKVEDILGPDGLGLTDGIFRLIDKPRKAEAASLTDVLISTTKPGAPRYCLIEPSLAKQWNEPAREIVIYGHVSLERPEHFTATDKNSGPIDATTNWCKPDFFFSNRVICNNDPAAFPGCLPVTVNGSAEGRSVAFPLTAEALTLFTPEELQQNASITWLQNGGVTCRLTLRLVSGGGESLKERICRIEKTYAQDELVFLEVLPVVAVWPNFRLQDDSWQLYYTFQAWAGSKEEFAVTPWLRGKQAIVKQRPHKFGVPFRVTRTAGYPDALVCQTPYFDRAKQREALTTGLLLLKPPSPHNPGNPGQAVVGVDFGSTASDIFMRVGASEPHPIQVKDRTVPITNFDSVSAERLRELFIPAGEKELKNILSVFHDYGEPPLENNKPSERVSLLDGHILYLVNDPDWVKDPVRVRHNLKWGEERERIAAKEYVLQLCLQAAAELAYEGIRDVEIRFSFPTAFSSADTTRFHANWKSIVKLLSSPLTGLDVHQNTDQREDGTYVVDNREAIAATRYFARGFGDGNRMDVGGGALIVDIGGGTTDLAIWKDFTLLTHSSVIFAGRDIFLAPLRRKPEFLQTIEPAIHNSLLAKDSNEAAFHARLDAVVAYFGESLIEKLHVKDADPTVQNFLKLLTLGLCGVGFYAGLLVRRLIDAKVYVPGRSIEIFFGGNGSKIFRWCAFDHFKRDAEISIKFVQAFRCAAGWPDNSRVGLNLNTTAPKTEVAYGLVGEHLRLNVHEDFATAMAGETFAFQESGNSHPGDWNTAPDIDRILQNAVRVDQSLPVFRSFLTSIGEHPDDELLDRIAGEVNVALAGISHQANEMLLQNPQADKKHLLRNEPMFIVALKRYLARNVEDWARRA